MATVFKCSRCGYQNETLCLFKKHLERKTECKPKVSNISFSEVKEQFLNSIVIKDKNKQKSYNTECDNGQLSTSPIPSTIEKKKRKRRLRNFGDENHDILHIKESLKKEGFVTDPLRGLQEIIKLIYFNPEHPENYVIRSVPDEQSLVEIHIDDVWVKRHKKYIYDKMIYLAYGIMEYNVSKKSWTEEFKNFITSMGEMDNDDILELIREEVDDTFINAETNLQINSSL